MTTASTPEQLRKMLCGSCLIAAPVLFLTGGALHPEESSNAVRQLEIISGDPGRWELAHWILAASMLLMMGAVIGLAHQLHEYRPGEAIVGGAITVAGVMWLFAVTMAEAAILPQFGRAGPAGVQELFVRISESGQFQLFLYPTLLLPIGLIAMSYGLYRAKVAETWVALCIAVGALAFGVSLPTGNSWVFLIGALLLGTGLVRIGLRVIRETDAEWAHTPQLHLRLAA